MICFYYGLTGFACTIYYRKHVFKSAKNFFFIGVLPMLGGISLGYVFVKSVIDLRAVDSGYAGPWLGVGAPFIIAAVHVHPGRHPARALDPALPRVLLAKGVGRRSRGARAGRPRAKEVPDGGLIVGYDGRTAPNAALREASDLSKRLDAGSPSCSASRRIRGRRGARLLGRPARAR